MAVLALRSVPGAVMPVAASRWTGRSRARLKVVCIGPARNGQPIPSATPTATSTSASTAPPQAKARRPAPMRGAGGASPAGSEGGAGAVMGVHRADCSSPDPRRDAGRLPSVRPASCCGPAPTRRRRRRGILRGAWPARTRPPPHPAPPMRLLLVEDDRMIGDGLRSALRLEGHAVDWVRDLSLRRGPRWPPSASIWCCSTSACHRAARRARPASCRGRPQPAARAASAPRRHAGDRADRPRRPGRPGQGPGHRRRRLPRQTLRARRADGPHARGDAPPRRPCAAAAVAPRRDARPHHPPGAARWACRCCCRRASWRCSRR